MQLKHAALAALLAGGAVFGFSALRDGPEGVGTPGGADPATAADAPPQTAAPADEAAAVAPPPPDPALAADAPDPRLAEAEAERDRLLVELAETAAERDALAEALAAREAEALDAETLAADAAPPPEDPAPDAEIERLLAELAGQAAEIDRLKSELTLRDAELAALRVRAKILPSGADLTVTPAALPAGAPGADPADAARFAERLEAAKSGSLPLPRPAAATVVEAAPTLRDAPLALVLFERASATLTTGAAERAAEAAATLVALNPARIRVTGHSDTTGSPEANMRLSQARAEAVAAALVAAGLPADRIEIAPHGETLTALPIPTGRGVPEPLNRCAGIYAVATVN